MIRETLYQLVDSPQRRLILTIGTFALGIVTILPLVDNYKEVVAERASLESDLVESHRDVDNLEEYQQQSIVTLKRLDAFQERVVSFDEGTDFRRHLVDLARQADCRVVRIASDEVLARPWMKKDHPLEFRQVRTKEPPTPYQLSRQKVSLSIGGQPENVLQFLQTFQKENRLLHATRFNLRPSNSERTVVVLEMEFWLIGLEDRKVPEQVTRLESSRRPGAVAAARKRSEVRPSA